MTVNFDGVTQRCSRCYTRKPYSEFSKGSYMCRPCMSSYTTERQNVDKIAALIYYSGDPPHCICCGELHIEFLCFDHTDGIKGKRTVGGKGLAVQLRSQGFPPGYQVLCFNCNNAKQLYGKCPHQKEGNII